SPGNDSNQSTGIKVQLSWASSYYLAQGGSHVIPYNVGATEYPINARCRTSWPNGVVPYTQTFGSNHANGCNFAMCDGSVQFISMNISQALYQTLGARNDGVGALP